jgi:hypothetical protein
MDFERVADLIEADSRHRNVPLADSRAIAKLLETAFLASLAREEGNSIRCDLLLIDAACPDPTPPKRVAEERWRCVALAKPIPLTVDNLVKIAQAADPWATAIAVHFQPTGEPAIWAIVDQQIHYNRWRYLDSDFGPSQPCGI